MEVFFTKQYNWIDFGITVLLLLAIFFILKTFVRLLEQAIFLRSFRIYLKSGIEQLLLFYEPAALLILLGVFVFVNPILHGFILVILLFSGFQHLKNYISGKVIQTSKGLNLGKKIKTGNLQGVIASVGRLGLEIQTDEGRHFIPYQQISNQGYTLVVGQEVGGFYQIELIPGLNDEQAILDHLENLHHLMASAPYLDIHYEPEFVPKESSILARVLLKEERHLSDLLLLMEEWGYQGKVTNLI